MFEFPLRQKQHKSTIYSEHNYLSLSPMTIIYAVSFFSVIRNIIRDVTVVTKHLPFCFITRTGLTSSMFSVRTALWKPSTVQSQSSGLDDSPVSRCSSSMP